MEVASALEGLIPITTTELTSHFPQMNMHFAINKTDFQTNIDRNIIASATYKALEYKNELKIALKYTEGLRTENTLLVINISLLFNKGNTVPLM